MFSGKREKALLEEELAALRETEKRERELLHKIAGQKDTAEEQFARMTASRAQMNSRCSRTGSCRRTARRRRENFTIR